MPPRLLSYKVEGMMLLSGIRYLRSLADQGIQPPYAVLLSLTGVKGAAINVGVQSNWADDDELTILDRDQLHFSEVILERMPQSVQDMGVMLRPLIEQIANAAGRAKSSSFGPDGQYLHMFR
jgi:hypothetical protein